MFQAVLQSPDLPQWALKIMVPAVGAMLALAAALAAACFVKAFGVTFLGRPRSPAAETAREVDRYSLAAMFILAALCLLAGILPGLVIDALSPISLADPRRPDAGAGQRRLALDRADCREPQLLQRIAGDAVHRGVRIRWPSSSSTASPRTRCGAGPPGAAVSPMPTPAAQYSGASFAQPIRRVFGTLLFHARDHVEMPPPGDIRPARLRIELHDLIWEGMYVPIAGAVGVHRGSAQSPAVPDHPATISAWSSPPSSPCSWCSRYGRDLRHPGPGRADGCWCCCWRRC